MRTQSSAPTMNGTHQEAGVIAFKHVPVARYFCKDFVGPDKHRVLMKIDRKYAIDSDGRRHSFSADEKVLPATPSKVVDGVLYCKIHRGVF